MKNIILFLKKKDLYLGITRYLLGLVMIGYGLTKILRTQFVVIPFSLWQRPLETLHGTSLAWAFLGYSPWFQVMLGFLELIPAILLLFRRTAFIGAILLLPMTLNVLLINHALNLWEDTKLISLILFLLNCTVLLFDWKRIKEVFLIIIGKGKKFKYSVVEIPLNTVIICVVLYMASQDLIGYRAQTNVLTGDWLNHHPNEWQLVSENIKDSTLKPRKVRMYFGAYGEYSEINDTGYIKRSMIFYDIDDKKHTLKFYNDKNKLINKCTYTLQGDSMLRVDKTIDSVKNIIVVQLFRKRIMQTGAN
jgi:hypothetical protein